MPLAFALIVALITLLSVYIFAAHIYWFPVNVSTHGAAIDHQFVLTLIICGVVFVLAQLGLAWFVYTYRDKGDSRQVIYSHGNNALESLWTTAAAIVFIGLNLMGYRIWAAMHFTGAASDWAAIALPRILYLNTVVLLASSAALETSRRYLRGGGAAHFKGWLYVTVVLGLAFIGGQLFAWRELAARGVYLATNPSSSFFYLLTAAHGLHLLGGIIALFYLVARAPQLAAGIKRRVAVDVTALYWHFVDRLWIYLLPPGRRGCCKR